MKKNILFSLTFCFLLHNHFLYSMNTKSNQLLEICYQAEKEDIQVIQKLIQEGANVNIRDGWNDTPLILACQENNKALAQLLIEKGANLNAKGHDGNTPLIIACKEKYKELVQLLIEKGVNLNAHNENGETALTIACQQNDEPIATLLIEKGANLNAHNSNGNTPLIIACQGGYTKLAQLLVAAGANVNTKDDDNRTALIWICLDHNKELAKLLIEKGANVNTTDDYGDTPLVISLLTDSKNLSLCLIESGADIDKPTISNKLFENECNNYLQLNLSIKKLKNKIDVKNGYLRSAPKKLIEYIDKLMLNPITPVFAKQSALIELLRYYRFYSKQVPKGKLLEYCKQIYFNYRFFSDTNFSKLLEFAITTDATDKLDRSVLKAIILCTNDEYRNKALSKLIEIKGNLYRSNGLFQMWEQGTKRDEAKDYLDALTLAKKMRRNKVFQSLKYVSIYSDCLKGSAKSEKYLPPELAAKVVSFMKL